MLFRSLQHMTGLASADFCHKGGFILTVGELKDGIKACRISQKAYVEEPVILYCGDRKPASYDSITGALEKKLEQIPGMEHAMIRVMDFPELPALAEEEYYKSVDLEKQEWKEIHKKTLKKILADKPEAVIIEGNPLMSYPLIHLLRKNHIPVLTPVQTKEGIELVRIPSCS